MIEPFLILATRSCVGYAKKVVNAIRRNPERLLLPDGFDYTEELSVLQFADGEMEVVLHNSVRGKTVFLFTTCARNEAGLSVESCKQELYHTIDVLQRSQAKEIIVFEPFISCSRSDRTTRRNSVGLWIHYKTLISLGADHLITYQLHSDKSKTIFDPCLCAVDDVPAISLLQRYLCEHVFLSTEKMNTFYRDSLLFCSVDAGGEKLAKGFASAFGTQLMVAHKQRSLEKANTVECINLLSAVPLKDKIIWIIDDMIDTGGSIYGLIQELSARECAEINVMIVHPVLSEPAAARLQELKDKGMIHRFVACDTIDCPATKRELPFMEVIESTTLSAHIVLTISLDRQMAPLIDGFSPLEYLERNGPFQES